MTRVRERAPDETAGATIVDDAAGLSAIHRPGCAAAIWRRSLPARFQAWIDALEPSQSPAARVVVRPQDMRAALASICDASGTPVCAERDMLVDDIAGLASVFRRLTPAPLLRLRLSAVASNACRKFHMDAVTARLVCTYRGPGTQYGLSVDGADPQTIRDTPTGAPILLRGKHWPERGTSNLLHRSPPIEGSGLTRFVMVLDPVVD